MAAISKKFKKSLTDIDTLEYIAESIDINGKKAGRKQKAEPKTPVNPFKSSGSEREVAKAAGVSRGVVRGVKRRMKLFKKPGYGGIKAIGRPKTLFKTQRLSVISTIKSWTISGHFFKYDDIKNELRSITGKKDWNPSNFLVHSLLSEARISLQKIVPHHEGCKRDSWDTQVEYFRDNANRWPLKLLFAIDETRVDSQRLPSRSYGFVGQGGAVVEQRSHKNIPGFTVIVCIRGNGEFGPHMIIFDHRKKRPPRSEAKGAKNRGRPPSVLCVMQERGVSCVCESREVKGMHECHWHHYVQHILLPNIPERSAIILDQMHAHLSLKTRTLMAEKMCTPLYMFPKTAMECSPLDNCWFRNFKKELVEFFNSVPSIDIADVDIAVKNAIIKHQGSIQSHFRHCKLDGSKNNGSTRLPIPPIPAPTLLPFGTLPPGAKLGPQQKKELKQKSTSTMDLSRGQNGDKRNSSNRKRKRTYDPTYKP